MHTPQQEFTVERYRSVWRVGCIQKATFEMNRDANIVHELTLPTERQVGARGPWFTPERNVRRLASNQRWVALLGEFVDIVERWLEGPRTGFYQPQKYRTRKQI